MTTYAVYIAICLSSVQIHACNQSTALRWVKAPESVHSLAACGMEGIAYIAQTGLAPEGTYLHVFCPEVR